MPQRADVIRNINRIQNRHRPNNVQSLADLEIVAPYTMTTTGEQFLQFDSGAHDDNRWLMFYSRNALEKLCASRMVLCDGTFKTVPSMFYQLYSLHGVVRDFTFPLVYVLATRKDEEFYRQILSHLKAHATEISCDLNPQYISSDFELAFMNAAKSIFPNSTIHGCLFHYTQSIWRYAVNKGLKVPFVQVPPVRSTIQCILALPFVPLPDIEETFDLIVINSPQPDDIDNVPNDVAESLQELLNFVSRTYVRGITARGRRRAISPRFPLQFGMFITLY